MDMRYATIIPVAGLSSRMGAFKPLLELDGVPMIVRTVNNAFAGGSHIVCVVTGHKACEVEEALSSYRTDEVLRAHNPTYASSDMLQSIKIGLDTLVLPQRSANSVHEQHILKDDSFQADKRLTEYQCASEAPLSLQGAFVIPGDMPAVSPRTFKTLQQEWTQHPDKDRALFVPSYEAKRGHPLLMGRGCFDSVMNFEGDGGLRQALAGFDWSTVPVDDPGILLDADTPEAFTELKAYLRMSAGVSAACQGDV